MNSATLCHRHPSVRLPALLVLLVCIALPTVPARAGTGDDPETARQVAVMLKVLSFDHNVKKLSRGAVRIGIVYNSQNAASVAEFERIGGRLARHLDRPVARLPLTFMGVDSASDDLDSVVRQYRISVLYVCNGNEQNLAALKAVSRRSRVLTITAEPASYADGISVRLARPGTTDAALTIDRTAARAEGRQFDSDFLELTELLQH